VIKVGMGHEQAGEFKILLDELSRGSLRTQAGIDDEGLARVSIAKDVDEFCIGPRGS